MKSGRISIIITMEERNGNINNNYKMGHLSTHYYCWNKFLRRVQALFMAFHVAANSSVDSNAVINYVIAIRLFRTVLRNRLKIFSNNNIVLLVYAMRASNNNVIIFDSCILTS